MSIHLRSRHTDWHTTLDCAILSNVTGTTPSTKLDTSNWKIPKDIKLADEQFDQPGSIELLIRADLFYEMLRSSRRTHPGNFTILQETVFGWTLTGRTQATFTQNDPQHTFLLREDNRLEHKLNRFWKVEPMEQTTMTTEQQVCEQHFLTHTQPSNKMEDLLSDFQPRRNPSNLDLLTSLQSEDYMQLKAGWNKIQNSRFSTTISWRNMKI